jgi:hypothetical protein
MPVNKRRIKNYETAHTYSETVFAVPSGHCVIAGDYAIDEGRG